MKFTAILTVLMGIVIGCFAGVRYASGGADRAEDSFVLGLALPLIFAAALVTTGTGLWVMRRRGCTVSEPVSVRHSAGGAGG